MKIRLDKYLTEMSVGSRSQVKQLAKSGKIMVNNFIIKDTGMKIDTETDFVCVNGSPVTYVSEEYYMLNKPAGFVTAVSDFRDKTVMDLLSSTNRKDLFPVGRLDKDTVGLLLITNNGELAHMLLSPKRHVDKKYYVELDDVLTPEMVQLITDGVFIEKGIKSQPAVLEIKENTPEKISVYLTIHEGRFHQVKKMFEAVGRQVIYLKRVAFGPLTLDETLKEGEYRMLTSKEIESLQNAWQHQTNTNQKNPPEVL